MIKRLTDILMSIVILLLFSWLLIIGYIISSFDCMSNGLFIQKRIGQYGKPFRILKLKTIHPKTRQISAPGAFLRKYKIDELPQFLNVLTGSMSVVGPRPDIPGYYDKLEGEDRKLLELKPGIISLASLKYIDEENLLSKHENPLYYNDKVIFPDKVRMNLDYYYNRSLLIDIKLIFSCLKGVFGCYRNSVSGKY